MDRGTRIQVVVSLGLAMGAYLLAAWIVPLLVVALMQEGSATPDDVDSIFKSMAQSSRIAAISNKISFVCLTISFASVVYFLFVIAAWFIRSAPQSNDSSSNDSSSAKTD